MSVSYTLRMPDNLRGFIEEESKRRGMTTAAFVVNACWVYLETPVSSGENRPVLASVAASPDRGGISTSQPKLTPEQDKLVDDFVPVANAMMGVKMNPAMERFVSVLPTLSASDLDPEPLMCSYTEYSGELGETMACGLPAHSMKQKHGNWRKV
jgi:hypothetical protein